MRYQYDYENIFAKILRKEIPNKTVMETKYSLSFRDINPVAPNHILVIPKGSYVDWSDFSSNASEVEQTAFTKMVGHVADLSGIIGSGYRIISNNGNDGHQEVPHLHMHVLGGAAVGPMVSRR